MGPQNKQLHPYQEKEKTEQGYKAFFSIFMRTTKFFNV